MKKSKSLLIIINLIVIIIYVNYSIYKKEQFLKKGNLILLELAPLDPRSLMQGDYMNLRYKFPDFKNLDSIPEKGYCVFKLKDTTKVVVANRLQLSKNPLNKNEYLIKYTYKNNTEINIGSETFFFQEGKAKKYEKAVYGGLKVDDDGNSTLIGLFDKNYNNIE